MSAESRFRELPLAGERVAFVGKLASVARSEAKRLVQEAGGQVCDRRSRSASLIVIGQGGLPVSRTGDLPRKLALAGTGPGGESVRVVREEDWLDLLGLSERGESIRRRYSLAEIAERTGVPAERVRRWTLAGLLAPAETVRGVDRFDFSQIAAVRRLDELVRAGVDLKRLKRTLSRLRRWLPEAERSLVRLGSLDRRMTLRDDRGALMDIDGQRLFEFAGDDQPAKATLSLVAFEEAPTPFIEQEFERACRLEEQEKFDAAELAYRKWLAKYGPDPDVCFNLANVLRALGRVSAAIERYRQAIELDPEHAAAWHNLGIALADEGRCDEAVEAARRAVELDPQNAAAIYSLADALDETSCTAEAANYWRAYLRLDEAGEFADYARQRLDSLES